jgi:hypothetical protein
LQQVLPGEDSFQQIVRSPSMLPSRLPRLVGSAVRPRRQRSGLRG